MRALSAKDVNLRWPKDAMARPFMVIDGAVIPEPVPEAFAHGRQARVPLISGANSDEHSARGPAASLDAWKRELQSEFGSHWERLFQAYGGEENFTRASRRLPTQKGFNWCNWIWASDHAATSGAPTFAYHFSHAPPLPEGATFAEAGTGPLGAFHTAEIPYVFGTLRNRPWPWRDEDFALSQIMSSYWLNFATTGDPNGPGLPRWPTLDPRAPTTMLFDGAAPRAGAQPDRALLDLWDETFARAGDARCAR
jgi:para-nitrobenzyl esterase